MKTKMRFFAFVLLVFFAAVWISNLNAEEWCFGIIPDTQCSEKEFPESNGVAIHAIDAINAEMIRQNVEFVVAVGDLANHSTPDALKTRKEHNRVLDEAGIPFYPLRGNHDSHIIESVTYFSEAFPDLPGTPGNIGSSPDLPNVAGKTYAFTHKGVKLILLDSFPLIDNGTKKGKAYSVNDYLPWIEKELKQDDHRAALVFSHLALVGQKHKSNLFGKVRLSQNNLPIVQNNFFACLQKNGVKYLFCGHDHLYHRADIKSPDGRSQIQQIICGSASDKFYRPGFPFTKREKPVSQELNRIGFMIVRVNEQRIQAEYYSCEPFGHQAFSPTWELRETFGYYFDGKKIESSSDAMKKFYRPSFLKSFKTEESVSMIHIGILFLSVSLAFVFRDRRYLPFLFVFLCIPVLLNFRYPFDNHSWDVILEVCCMLVGFLGLTIRSLTFGYAPDLSSGKNTRLETKGMYSIVRHPLCLGNYFLWLAPVLFLHSVCLCIIYTLMFVLYYRNIIIDEESALYERHSREYENWVKKTPTCLPNFFRWQRPENTFSWKTVVRSEYCHLFGLVAVMAGVEHVGDYAIKGTFTVDTAWTSIFLFSTGMYLFVYSLLGTTAFIFLALLMFLGLPKRAKAQDTVEPETLCSVYSVLEKQPDGIIQDPIFKLDPIWSFSVRQSHSSCFPNLRQQNNCPKSSSFHLLSQGNHPCFISRSPDSLPGFDSQRTIRSKEYPFSGGLFSTETKERPNRFEAVYNVADNTRIRVWNDFGNMYHRNNALNYGAAILGTGLLANTQGDRNFQRWYHKRTQCWTTDQFSEFSKVFGEGKYFIPITVTSAFAYRYWQERTGNHERRPVGDFFGRTARAYAAGAPALLLGQYLLGGDRPRDGSSYWKPFQQNHGISGHAFIGATPFITAAHMTDNYWAKSVFYTLSILPAWSRVNEDAHYLSQVLLGWYLSYLSVRAVSETEGLKPLPKGLTLFPILESNGVVGLGLLYKR